MTISKKELILKGSQTAKNGFKNERDICDKFNNWENDKEAQKWLVLMNYSLHEIEFVKAVVLTKFKADINVQIQVKLKTEIDVENIQVKLVSNKVGFNQVDKRWLSVYKEMWNIPEGVFKLLQYYTGEVEPFKKSKSLKRMFANEFSENEQQILLEWLKENKTLILTDILRGRGKFCAEWVLVAQKLENNSKWVLVNINNVLQYFSQGEILITSNGTIHIGKVTMQRKGGDNGRPTANMLQFKINPAELFSANLNNSLI